MIAVRRACRAHRAVLLDLVERGDRGPSTPAALDHVEVCRSCEREVVGVALTVAALRRSGAVYRRLPEPLAARPPVPVPSRHDGRWAWRLQLGSLVAGAALAAAVVMPQAGMPTTPFPVAPVDSATPVHGPGLSAWQVAERRLASSPDPGPVAAVEGQAGSLPPRYPDTMFKPVKEVPASDASVRVLEPR